MCFTTSYFSTLYFEGFCFNGLTGLMCLYEVWVYKRYKHSWGSNSNKCRGDVDVLEVTYLSMRYRHRWTWPHVAAAWRGVHSSVSRALTDAPNSNSNFSISSLSSIQHWNQFIIKWSDAENNSKYLKRTQQWCALLFFKTLTGKDNANGGVIVWIKIIKGGCVCSHIFVNWSAF